MQQICFSPPGRWDNLLLSLRELAENLFEGKPSQLMSHLLLSTSLDPDEVRYMRQALDEAAMRSRQLTGPEGGAPA